MLMKGQDGDEDEDRQASEDDGEDEGIRWRCRMDLDGFFVGRLGYLCLFPLNHK